MKILVLVLVALVTACAPAPAPAPKQVSYKDCMRLIESGTLLSQADRDFCETLNK